MGRGVKGFFREVRDSFRSGYRPAATTSRRSNDPTNHKRRPLLTFLLIMVPIAMLVAVGSREWFLNWPAMFAGALLLAILRGE